MPRRAKSKRSSHLQDLESAFTQRAKRVSRLALVLDQPEDQEVENDRPLISPPQEDQPEKNAQIPQTTDRMLIQQTADRMPEQTADGLMYEGQNKPNIPHTPDPAVSTRDPILLSPNQWLVLNALKDIEQQGRITSYRDISTVSSVNFHSVRDSIRVLERVGAILEKRVVKTPREQGFYVSLNKDLSFTQTSAAKLKGVKRGGFKIPQTVSGMRDVSERMSVLSLSIYKHTYSEILRLFPPPWSIREQVLKDIAQAFPSMTGLEFKHSCRLLIEQGKAGPKIQHHNAWLKGAFEKAGGPLVTETDLDVQLTSKPAEKSSERPGIEEQGEDADLSILRQYMAASAEERTEIDQLAAKMAAATLKMVSEDKRAGVLEEAKLEAAREYFSTQA